VRPPTLRAVFRRWLAVTLSLLGTWTLAAGPAAGSGRGAAASGPVPQGFVGMVVDEPVWPDVYVQLGPQLDTMVGAGVQSVRVVFNWASAQPYPNWKAVPAAQRNQFTNVGGVPTDFGTFDALVEQAAARGLTVLPSVLNAPAWDGIRRNGASVRIPRSDRPFAAFVRALVRRYGPDGTVWASMPQRARRPITMWQIWNEPNITPFWPVQPFARRYVGLLRAARAAIKGVDPHAEIVLAGLPNYSWSDLGKIYAVPGARSLFDVVAVHPYTRTPKGVLEILTFVRRVMDSHGDRAKPLLADEISWPSSLGKTDHNTGYDFATTEAGQARNIAQVLPMLARARRSLGLLGFYYYDWAGLERPHKLAFDFAGLFRIADGKFVAKPAFGAFKRAALAIEGCRSKGPLATDCVS
jgi:hypothetical protein